MQYPHNLSIEDQMGCGSVVCGLVQIGMYDKNVCACVRAYVCVTGGGGIVLCEGTREHLANIMLVVMQANMLDIKKTLTKQWCIKTLVSYMSPDLTVGSMPVCQKMAINSQHEY